MHRKEKTLFIGFWTWEFSLYLLSDGAWNIKHQEGFVLFLLAACQMNWYTSVGPETVGNVGAMNPFKEQNVGSSNMANAFVMLTKTVFFYPILLLHLWNLCTWTWGTLKSQTSWQLISKCSSCCLLFPGLAKMRHESHIVHSPFTNCPQTTLTKFSMLVSDTVVTVSARNRSTFLHSAPIY